MAITLVAAVTGNPGANGGATGAIDTTGATLIVIAAGWWTGGGGSTVAYSDSKGNSWTAVTVQVGSTMRQQFAYCLSPIVGTGHTVSVTGTSTYPAILAYAFAGTTGASYDTRSGTGGASVGPTVPTGSVTPVTNNALLLTGFTINTATLPASLAVAPAGFTLTLRDGVGGVNFPGAAAWYVQPTAAAINPTWSWPAFAFEAAASTVVFSGATLTAGERVQTYVWGPL